MSYIVAEGTIFKHHADKSDHDTIVGGKRLCSICHVCLYCEKSEDF